MANFATNVKKGKTNLEALINSMNKMQGAADFKLNQAGTVRIRLLPAVGNGMPIVPKFEHWITMMDTNGEPKKKPVGCPKSKGIATPCPICLLTDILNSSGSPEFQDLGKDIRRNERFGVYLIDRTYMLSMAMSKQKVEAVPEQEKVYAAYLPKSVINSIMETIKDTDVGGDCFDFESGFDFKITGRKEGIVKYTVVAIPHTLSPAVNPDLLTGMNPIDDNCKVGNADAVMDHVHNILSFIGSSGTEEGSAIIDNFSSIWEEISGEVVETTEDEEPEDVEDGVEEFEDSEEEEDSGQLGTIDENGITYDDSSEEDEEEDEEPIPEQTRDSTGKLRRTPTEVTSNVAETSKVSGSTLASKITSLRSKKR